MAGFSHGNKNRKIRRRRIREKNIIVLFEIDFLFGHSFSIHRAHILYSARCVFFPIWTIDFRSHVKLLLAILVLDLFFCFISIVVSCLSFMLWNKARWLFLACTTVVLPYTDSSLSSVYDVDGQRSLSEIFQFVACRNSYLKNERHRAFGLFGVRTLENVIKKKGFYRYRCRNGSAINRGRRNPVQNAQSMMMMMMMEVEGVDRHLPYACGLMSNNTGKCIQIRILNVSTALLFPIARRQLPCTAATHHSHGMHFNRYSYALSRIKKINNII